MNYLALRNLPAVRFVTFGKSFGREAIVVHSIMAVQSFFTVSVGEKPTVSVGEKPTAALKKTKQISLKATVHVLILT